MLRLLPLTLLALLALPVQAQHDHHAASGDTAADTPSGLSADEAEGLLAGRGLGFAKPAEMHSYPGPLHVLELADALALTDEQTTTAKTLRADMSARATELGARLVEVERHLDRIFASGVASPEAISRMTAHAGSLRGEIRAAHLIAHIAMRDVLTPEQTAAYDHLRGYRD